MTLQRGLLCSYCDISQKINCTYRICTVFMAQSRNRFSWSKWQSSTYIARVSISTSLASKNPHVAAHANDACFIYTCSADARSKVL